MAASRETVYASIEGVCDVHTDLDQEQILDIILARGERKGDKFEDYVSITQNWTESEWKSVLREFYLSYQKAALCTLAFQEIDPNMRVDTMITEQKKVTAFKKGPDNYYVHLINGELERPVEGEPLGDNTSVLLSVYAAISSGENYGSVGYPPKCFISDVLKEDITPADFYSTVLDAMKSSESFEVTVCKLAKEHKEEVKQMKADYRKLVGRDMSTVVGKVAAVSTVAATTAAVKTEHAVRKGKKFAGKVKEASYSPAEEKAASTAVQTEDEAKAQGAHVKTFAKWGIIMLIINGTAAPTKFVLGVTYIKMLMGNGFFKMFAPSLFTIFTCFIPVAGCVCAGAMVFAGIVPGKDKRKTLAYFIMSLGILCTAYSVMLLIKTLMAMITAWATETFTLENIAHSTTKGIFDVGKGLAKGVWDGITGWFK